MFNPLFMLQQSLAALKANPAAFLAQRGINLPAGCSDPNAILQQMVSSGRISQQQLNRAQQMAQMFSGGCTRR